jgi:hypothetical protein
MVPAFFFSGLEKVAQTCRWLPCWGSSPTVALQA